MARLRHPGSLAFGRAFFSSCPSSSSSFSATTASLPRISCRSAPLQRQHRHHPHYRLRSFHSSSLKAANPLPITAAGPPPSPPEPTAVAENSQREERRRRVVEAIKDAQHGHGGLGLMGKVGGEGKKEGPGSALKRRFWRDVSVETLEDGRHTILLDARAVRAPLTKQPLLIPASKPHLATAIAAEWDALSSAHQALKPHLVPLTSLAARALDLEAEDRTASSVEEGSAAKGKTTEEEEKRGGRAEVERVLLRYLETDTLLCLEPERDPLNGSAAQAFASQYSHPSSSSPSSSSSSADQDQDQAPSLRSLQISTMEPILSWLTTHLWPGVTIKPVLDGSSLVPSPPPPETLAVIKGWLHGLSAWDLAGLERAVLASKSFCVAARLVAEWSEGGAGVVVAPPTASKPAARHDSGEAIREATGTRRADSGASGRRRFGIEEAAAAASLEVRWQTGRWGEVEDSHDVEKEDLRRQLGAAVLLVSGIGPRRK